jgi:GNAT superfamily N-acetyltransferase
LIRGERGHTDGVSGFCIRPATAADLQRMVEIELAAATLFPAGVLPPDAARVGSEAEIGEAISSGLAWVAADARHEQPVGFLAARSVACSLHFVEMDVLPSHGRRGIGALLVEHALAAGRARGLRDATLTTFLRLPWNAPFYARHGFTVLGELASHPHLQQALEREARRGLTGRVAMRRDRL